MQNNNSKINVKELWHVFGNNPRRILQPEWQDKSRSEIQEATGCVVALRDVNFQVQEGQVFVVMGLSGSGKSTLVRCLTRLVRPTTGKVYFDGDNILDYSQEQLIDFRRQKIAMVFQHYGLLPHRHVIDNVAYGLEIRGMEKEERYEVASKVIDTVGLKGWENYFPREMSGGMQQRIGLARALAVDPEILLMDEPFSGLDPLIRREMQDELIALESELNKTIVFITHDFDEALRLADRIAIMFNGSIEQIGKPEDIVLNPATEYVSRFTSDVPREKVLRVGSVMDPPSDDERVADRAVNVTDRVENVVEYVLGQRLPVPVVDDKDAVVGVLHQAHVLKVVFPPRTEHA
jgi:glycine betaine/proline transport system ATP-binding protein